MMIATEEIVGSMFVIIIILSLPPTSWFLLLLSLFLVVGCLRSIRHPHHNCVYYHSTRLCVLSLQPVVVYIYRSLHPVMILCIVAAPNCVYYHRIPLLHCMWYVIIFHCHLYANVKLNTYCNSFTFTIDGRFSLSKLGYFLCCCPNIWTWIIYSIFFRSWWCHSWSPSVTPGSISCIMAPMFHFLPRPHLVMAR